MFKLDKITDRVGLMMADKDKKKWLWPTVIAVIFILVLLVSGNFLVLFELSHLDKFYPGSRIGGINLAGLTKDQAFDVIEEATRKIDQQTVQVEYFNGQSNEVFLLDQLSNPDSANDFLVFDVYKTVYDNYNLGHAGNWGSRLIAQLQLKAGYIKQQAAFELNRDYLKKVLASQM